MPPRCVPHSTPETGEGSGQGSINKAVESLTKALEGMAAMMEQQTVMMQWQRDFMTNMMGRERRQRGQGDAAIPPPPPRHPQPIGEQWLYRRFKDKNPSIFKGSIDAKVAEEWLRELEKIFRVMDCTTVEKSKLVEFPLKNEGQVWWESLGWVHEDGEESIDYELFKVKFEKKYVPSVARDRKAVEFACLVQGWTSVTEYEVKFSKLSRYAPHVVASPKEKARKFREGLCLTFKTGCFR